MTKEKYSANSLWIVLFSGVAIGTLIGVLIYASSYEAKSKIYDSAILDITPYDWGVNEYNPRELLIQYWVYNYGNKEAKNVEVTCKMVDDYEEHVSKFTENIGNIASNSVIYKEIIGPDKTNAYSKYSAVCYVSKCDNCEILYKKIPELVEEFEKD